MKLNLILVIGVLIFAGQCADKRTPVKEEVQNLVECDQDECFTEGGGRVYGPRLQPGLYRLVIKDGNRPTVLRSTPVEQESHLGEVTHITSSGDEYLVTANGEQYIVADCRKGAQLFRKGSGYLCR